MQEKEQSQLLRALNLWIEITGVDPSSNSMSFSNWELRDTFDELQEAIDLDPSEVTAHLLLAHFVRSYLSERSFSLLDLLQDPTGIATQLDKPRELLAILDRPDAASIRDGFIETLRESLGHYGAGERDDVTALLSRQDDIAVLRRDALRSMARLRVDQFLDGDAEPDSVKPVYNKTVHQWWNINSMLAAATRMPSGVSLNLVRHPDALQSYFCFMIRNGGNLLVLSDAPEYAHPLQAFMTRRPDRAFSKRASRNWFPYDLLDLEYDEESDRVYAKESSQRGLVAYQNAALPLRPIAELPAEELTWVSMMFDLIVDRFWRRGEKAPSLSYTAEMLKSDAVLIEAAKSANLPVPAYQPVGLPRLTLQDVVADASTDEEIGKKYHQPNRWMEDRYAKLVPEEVFNLLGAPEQAFALDSNGGVAALDPLFHTLHEWDQSEVLSGRALLEKVDATSFGSKESISADRKFIARVNLAKDIRRLAREEYEEKKPEVLAWYRDRVAVNAPNLLRWCANQELWVDDGVHPCFSRYLPGSGNVRCRRVNPDGMHSPDHHARRFLTRVDLTSDKGHHHSGVTLGSRSENGSPLCFLNKTSASYWVLFQPANATELALLAGCSVEELPVFLRHWNLLKIYTGNSILDRVDPMNWKALNPWDELPLAVRLAFSKRGMAKIDKSPAELPALPGLLTSAPW